MYLSYWSSKPSMHLPFNIFLFHFDIKYFIKKILLSLRCIKYWTDSIIEFIMVHHNRPIISNLSWLLWWFNTILATVDSFCFHQRCEVFMRVLKNAFPTFNSKKKHFYLVLLLLVNHENEKALLNNQNTNYLHTTQVKSRTKPRSCHSQKNWWQFSNLRFPFNIQDLIPKNHTHTVMVFYRLYRKI